MSFNPESNPIQMGHEPVAADALADTSAWFDMSKCKGLYIVVSHYRGGDTDLVLTVHHGTAASGTTELQVAFPIWYASSALTDPTLDRQTDGYTLTIDTGVYTGSQVVVFYVPGGICNRYVQLGASGGHASSIASVTYIPDGFRYAQDDAL